MKQFHYYCAGVLLSSAVFAQQPIELIGTQPLSFTISSHAKQAKQRRVVKPAFQTIQLLKFKLSPQARKRLKARQAYISAGADFSSAFKANLPERVQLGMNGVPVLDQGAHGACVTFAVTGALDAALDSGDYISQLCQLQLGRYLEYNAFGKSGWNGAWATDILNRNKLFGIMSKEKEKEYGCGGLNAYPVLTSDPEGEMSIEAYHAYSEKISKKDISWDPILDSQAAVHDRVDTGQTLTAVKKALDSGDRVVFGVLLADLDRGIVGASGKYHAENDSWVLSIEMLRDVYLRDEMAGHEMVITGYDDAAVAVDEEGRPYKGLLTLRNSWGNDVGNKGEFYMAYDYFKAFVLEAHHIRKHERASEND